MRLDQDGLYVKLITKKFFVELSFNMETEREALKLGSHGGFGQESPARTFYPGAPHKYVLAAQGRRA